jgi:pyridoxamine 5'-phosphate oxidase
LFAFISRILQIKNMSTIADIRKEYILETLDEKGAETNAIRQFDKWWEEATASKIDEVNAMTLATATPNGIPSARIVLLKGYDDEGFVFFTNYESNKGKDLAANPNACLVFFWKELERQVRVEGRVEKVSNEESDAYFFSRPQGSQVGAWASPQSSIIEGREVIEANVLKYSRQFEAQPLQRPAHWGGYRLKPQLIEFWQGRESRLHDRLQYTLQSDYNWKIERLAP